MSYFKTFLHQFSFNIPLPRMRGSEMNGQVDSLLYASSIRSVIRKGVKKNYLKRYQNR
jgi:hypothetical protein